MRSVSICRFLALGSRANFFLRDGTHSVASMRAPHVLSTIDGVMPRYELPGSGHGGEAATSSSAAWGAWLLATIAVVPGGCSADSPARQGTPEVAASRLPTTLGPSAAAAAPSSGGSSVGAADNPPALTNHPLEYDPVTNEHTAKMTLARTAALEFYNAGKYPQAEAKFREAVAEAQLGFEAGDPHIASAKNNLAEFLRNVGRWNEAEALYKEALDLLERNFGEKHWLFVAALHNLALSYEARGDLAAARAAMERVLALRLSMLGPRHFLYADSLFALGHLLRAVPGRAEAAKAMGMMEEAVRVLEEAERPQVNVLLYWLPEIAAFHTADGRPELAAAALRRAVAHMTTDRGEDAASASALNEQLVDALAAAGRPAEAAEAAEAALAARRRVFGEGALVVAQSEMRVAQLQLQAAQAGRRDGAGAGPRQPPAAATPPQGPAEAVAEAGTGAAAPAAGPGPGPALRALQHAEAAARISSASLEECSRGGLLSGPSADKLVKRLRAAHVLGSAAKLVATLAGVTEPAAAAAATKAAADAAAAEPASRGAGGASGAGPAASSGTRKWSWWPFGGGSSGSSSQEPAADAAPSSAQASGKQAVAPPPPPPPLLRSEPVAELVLADRRLQQAVAALTAAVQAGKQLLQAVGTGRRKLPEGMSVDEVAGLLVEAQLQLLDVLERLGLVLQARAAAGQGRGAAAAAASSSSSSPPAASATDSDLVERHRRVMEQQERVAMELLAQD